MSTVTERVAAGAAFLDERDPDWWKADVERPINLGALDLARGDSCVLGQRCPAAALAAWLGAPPEFSDDHEFRYNAYAQLLSGLPSAGEATELNEWAAAFGFQALQSSGIYTREDYDALTREWRRVIAARRGLSPDCGNGCHAPLCDGRNCSCDCHRSAS